VTGSQSVAAQVASVLVQAVAQQWPDPAAPHTPEKQSSFSVQAPVPMAGTQAPALQKNCWAQSRLAVQVVLQPASKPASKFASSPSLLQAKLSGQVEALSSEQVPPPLQARMMSELPTQ
jgi:hypothetical protein